MQRRDFDYVLPPELIAQHPLPRRSDSRLLLLDGAVCRWQDQAMRDLPDLLRASDLLIFNDTRVLPARLLGRKLTGGKVEILLERPGSGRRAWVQLRASNATRPGQQIDTDGGRLRVVGRADDLWEIELPYPAIDFFERYGAVPLPPYIDRPADQQDRERYQSLFARVPGAVAAPTASLHFDAGLLAAIERRGVHRAHVTLHVAAGTFAPVRSEDLDAHRMHGEWYEIPEATLAAIVRSRAAGGRIIAVGTTVARALESAAATGTLQSGPGETTLFMRPGYRFRVIDALLTNFHLPQSTLLMLVAAFAGLEATLAAYAHAVTARYRFFSYGDAMLVLPHSGAREPPVRGPGTRGPGAREPGARA